jgi:phosphate uptake regulator
VRNALSEQLAELELRIEPALDEAPRALARLVDGLVGEAGSSAAVIRAEAEQLRAAARGVDSALVAVVARHAPVAGNLRLVLALLQLA